jgi:hypothetical protein
VSRVALPRRVLGINPPTVEVSFEDSEKMLGFATTGMATHSSVVSADGGAVGEGHGIISTQDADAVVCKGSGKGKILPGGAVSYRGIVLSNDFAETD